MNQSEMIEQALRNEQPCSRTVITTGDITPCRDANNEMSVMVLSNSIHLSAGTARIIACPFIPSEIPSRSVPFVSSTNNPDRVAPPELVQCLPAPALAEPIGNIGTNARCQIATLVKAIIS